uniref:ARAD1D28050p n=1 Tax=Blastobotrys adeninivorans TaxID=409370 RepID=A0A060TAM6_BLAAD
MRRLRASSSSSFLSYFTQRNPGDSDSDLDDAPTPVVVNNHPRNRTRQSQSSQHDSQASAPDDIPLPPIEAFSYSSIVDNVQPEQQALTKAIENAVHVYRDELSAEIRSVIQEQDVLTHKMQLVDRIAYKALQNAHRRSHQVGTQLNALRGMETVADAAEAAYASLSTIVSLLGQIESILPENERLSPQDSPHRAHYPHLHHLLQEYNRPRPARASASFSESTHSVHNDGTSVENEQDSNKESEIDKSDNDRDEIDGGQDELDNGQDEMDNNQGEPGYSVPSDNSTHLSHKLDNEQNNEQTNDNDPGNSDISHNSDSDHSSDLMSDGSDLHTSDPQSIPAPDSQHFKSDGSDIKTTDPEDKNNELNLGSMDNTIQEADEQGANDADAHDTISNDYDQPDNCNLTSDKLELSDQLSTRSESYSEPSHSEPESSNTLVQPSDQSKVDLRPKLLLRTASLPENYPQALLSFKSVAPKQEDSQLPTQEGDSASTVTKSDSTVMPQKRHSAWFGGPSERPPQSAEDQLRRLIN